jgi:hypothetical protein
VALAYLMHSWPLIGNSLVVIRRLQRSLRELKEYHHEALQSDEITLLVSLLDIE